VTGKWVIARYRAELHEIEQRFGKAYELLNADVRNPTLSRSFSP